MGTDRDVSGGDSPGVWVGELVCRDGQQAGLLPESQRHVHRCLHSHHHGSASRVRDRASPAPRTAATAAATGTQCLAAYVIALSGEREMFYLTTHSTHFIYSYMASDIWLRTILIVRKETCCRHIGYSHRLTARVLLYRPSHRQDNTYHSLCYTSRAALAGTRNSPMGPPP